MYRNAFLVILAALVGAIVLTAPAVPQIPGPAGVVVNQTPVQGGTSTNCLYVNGAVVGQYACGAGAASGVTVGTSAIAGGTTTRVLFDNAGVLGEYTNAQLTGLITALTNASLANMANSTVKCRTTAGTGAPEDCTAAQTAAIIGVVGGAQLSKVVNATYNLATASGTQDITGFGFDPTAVQVNYGVNGAAGGGTGYYAGLAQGSTSLASDATTWLRQTGSALFYSNAASSVFQIGQITLITDGVRINWTKAGAPAGTLGITLLGSR